MALRQHDVVLAEGRFRIVLTDRRRLFAEIDAPQTALGPLHLAFEIDRRPHARELALRNSIPVEHIVGAPLSDIGRAVSRAASEAAFNAASNLATTVAPPAFVAVHDLARQGSHLLNAHLFALPEETRRPIESAARIVMRARLGDLPSKQFIARIVSARRSGAPDVRPVADALLAGNHVVAQALGPSPSVTPHPFDQMASALQHGDFRALHEIAVRPSEDVEESDGFDDYVRHFGASEATIDESASSRFVQPLARVEPSETSVGFDLGAALNVASDAASGNIGGAIGGAAGGGAAKGAAIGGAIGSVIPGVGTAIGGAIGGIIGGIGSLFGGGGGPIDFEHLMGGVGMKLVRQIADKVRQAPRWQAHFQAIYRHLPAGTANVKGLNDLVARELFPHDALGKDATTGHPDGLAEWFAQQPDWERLLHGPGVPPGDRHQLEARVHAARRRLELVRRAWETLFHRRATASRPFLPVLVGSAPSECGCSALARRGEE
jgi:hypothetical protein